MTEFEKWFRDYMNASINHYQVTGKHLSGEREIKDVAKYVEENYIKKP